jgi:hypothetical protein
MACAQENSDYVDHEVPWDIQSCKNLGAKTQSSLSVSNKETRVRGRIWRNFLGQRNKGLKLSKASF